MKTIIYISIAFAAVLSGVLIGAVSQAQAAGQCLESQIELGREHFQTISEDSSQNRQHAETITCPNDSVATAVLYKDSNGQYSDMMDGITLECTRVVNGALGSSQTLSNSDLSGNSRSVAKMSCPAGQVVTSVHTKDVADSSDNVSDAADAITVSCAPLNNLSAQRKVANSDLSSNRATQSYSCAANQALSGISYNQLGRGSVSQADAVSDAVDNLTGIRCKSVQQQCVQYAQDTPNNGGGGSNNNQLRCDDEDIEVEEGDRVSFKLDVSGATADLEFDLDDEPRGADLSDSGRFSWRTEEGDADTYRFEYTATDGVNSCEGDIRIDVEEENSGSPRNNRNNNDYIIIPSTPTIPTTPIITPVTPTIVEVPVTRTVVVQSQNQIVTEQSSGLEQFNIRVERDSDGNIFVSWETNIPARAQVVYGLASQADASNYQYEYTSQYGGVISTFHRVALGQLQENRSYFFRVVSEIGTDKVVSNERSFLQISDGEYSGANMLALGSAIATLGILIFNPFFLLLVIIALLLLIIFKRKAGNNVAVYQQPAKVEIG